MSLSKKWKTALGVPDSAATALAEACQHEADGHPELAASAIDAAYLLDPTDAAVVQLRTKLLDSLAIVERDLELRYIPAGAFIMGSKEGDADERPVHVVKTGAFWMSAVPISWTEYCARMGWQPPPQGCPESMDEEEGWGLSLGNRIRLQYCEDHTLRGVDWHAHLPQESYTDFDGNPVDGEEIFGKPPRSDEAAPVGYSLKPMVALDWTDAEKYCQAISDKDNSYRLPTEAEWEKAARGGVVGASYPWGNDPTAERADCNRFEKFSIYPSRHFAPNSYGIYAMAGGVCEWIVDWYDAKAYKSEVKENPRGPEKGKERVLRGGSWADAPEACTVSFRMSLPIHSSANEDAAQFSPTVGFRVVRVPSND